MDIEQRYQAIIKPPVKDVRVRLGIKMGKHALLGIDFLDEKFPEKNAVSPPVLAVCEQLQAYFENPEFSFRIPLGKCGTTFQNRVWQQLCRIGFGKTLSYGVLAQQLDSGARAVANACRHNPFPIIVPCHRVVAKAGIGGYAGDTSGAKLEFKQWLLIHEAKSHDIV